MKQFMSKKVLSAFAALIILINTSLPAFATDYEAAVLERKALPIQSNEEEGWPEGPEIGAEGAILMEAGTGTILYAKNIHEELYPASTTKIMTCLLAVENASLDDNVTFSYNAVSSVPADGSNIGMDAGEYLSLKECLYGIMVGSANAVSNAVAEHVGGTIEHFVELMNEKAKSLGCTNTHFANANGLQDSNHYTSAYDLALISREFFSNDLLCRVGNTPRYHFEPSAGQPDDFYLNNKHKLISGEIPYNGIAGGKTGYTALARETLVTCAERDGMKLICVVFMEESPAQFTDTVTLFDYGFNNFKLVNVKNEETGFIPDTKSFFTSGTDIFGSSYQVLDFDRNDYICIPQNKTLADMTSTVSYDVENSSPGAVAVINYSFGNTPVGSADILVSESALAEPSSDTNSIMSARVIYLNVKHVIIAIAAAGGLLILLFSITGLISSYTFSGTKEDRKRLNRRKKEARKKKSPHL